MTEYIITMDLSRVAKITLCFEKDYNGNERSIKMIKETIKITGKVKIELFGPDGGLKDLREIKNLIVTAGLNHIADQMSDQGEDVMSHVAIGTGTTAAAVGNTALVTELDRNALTSKTQATNTVTYIADWAAGDGTGVITEAGILNAAANGTLLTRIVFAAVNKLANDALRITWVHTYAAV